MKLQFLNDGFYMNPETGSVDTALGWERDFFADDEMGWIEWGGDKLLQVEKINDEWVEV